MILNHLVGIGVGLIYENLLDISESSLGMVLACFFWAGVIFYILKKKEKKFASIIEEGFKKRGILYYRVEAVDFGVPLYGSADWYERKIVREKDVEKDAIFRVVANDGTIFVGIDPTSDEKERLSKSGRFTDLVARLTGLHAPEPPAEKRRR